MGERQKKQINNCYRAILAQVNYLDGIYKDNHLLKDIYAELTVLAFNIMADDMASILKSIDEIKFLSLEMGYNICSSRDKIEMIKMVLGEIKTHLDYLAWNIVVDMRS